MSGTRPRGSGSVQIVTHAMQGRIENRGERENRRVGLTRVKGVKLVMCIIAHD